MVFWKTQLAGFDSDSFVAFMKERGIKVYGILVDEYRFVTSNDVSRESIDFVIKTMREYLQTL